MKINDVLTQKIKDIDVSSKELKELKGLADGVIGELKKKGLSAFIGGSLAKGTVVKKKSQDVDIFVVFDSENDILQFEGVLKKIKLPGKLKKVHGSRDYFQIVMSTVTLELIPTVRIKNPEDANNVTDVSLAHVKYVAGMIGKNKGIADEIRLAKSYCHAQKFYGAESYIKGFSGYSLEVLVIHYGGFLKFLKRVGKTRVVDPAKHFKSGKEVLFELNASKISGPLVVVDPTYKLRNITAGLGKDTFLEFLMVAKAFLKRPSLDFFEEKEIDVDGLRVLAKKKKAKLFKVDLVSDRQEGDIVGTKVLKFFDFFLNELKRNGQEVLGKEFDYIGSGKKAVGYVVVKENNVVERKGPPVAMKTAVAGFKKEHGDSYVKKGYVWSKKETGVKNVFKKANMVGDEMGAWGKDLIILSE